MYEQRFGLTRNPFTVAAEGAAVFVGPRQAKVVSALQKALAGADGVVTISGPAGVGKTAIVTRALETNVKHQMVAWVGRMRLAPDEVLELLLAGFGVSRQPASTVQRFAAFKRILMERAAAKIQIVIVVEDALRIGDNALLELEALTAKEAGNIGGANIVLMGGPSLPSHLAQPELARLRQRARHGQVVEPLGTAEVQAYLKHCVRLAGGEFDNIFDAGVAEMVHRCSEGIPRVINNICDAAMQAAHEQDANRISSSLVQQVAYEVYGLEPATGEQTSVPESVDPVPAEPTPVVDSEPQAPAVTEQPQVAPEPDAKSIEPEPPTLQPEPVEIPSVPVAEAEEPQLPPVVADALAQEEEEIDPPQVKFDDTINDKLLIGDTGTVEQPDLDANALKPSLDDTISEKASIGDVAAAPGTDDDLENALIADTGANIPPQFKPDPEIEIQASQLADSDPLGDALQEAEADDLPTLSNSMKVDIEAAKAEAMAEAEPVASPKPVDEPEPKGLSSTDEDEAADDDEFEQTITIRPPDMELPQTLETPVEAQPAETPPAPEPPAVETPAQQTTAEMESEAPETAESTTDELEDALEATSIKLQRLQELPPENESREIKPEKTDRPVPDLDALEAAISAARTASPSDDAESPPVADLALDTEEVVSNSGADAGLSLQPDTAEAQTQSAPAATIQNQTPEPELPADSEAPPELIFDDSPVAGSEESSIDKTASMKVLKLEDPQAEPNSGVSADQTDDAVAQPQAAETAGVTASLPQITLDKTLEDQRKEGQKLDEMAAELANANSLEDISDVMAETLFGEEFEQIAAEALANPPAAGTIPGEEDDEEDDVVASAGYADEGTPANDPAAGLLEIENPPGAPEPAAESKPTVYAPDAVPDSMSPPTDPLDTIPAAQDAENPECIEDQFKTSITQTLKALNVDNIPTEDTVAEDKKSGGLFGRLKKKFIT